MELSIRENIRKAKNTAKESSNGVMIALIMVNSPIITSKVRGCMFGPTAESTMANGNATKWKAKGPALGLMAGSILVSIRMIRSMGKVLSNGPTAKSTSVAGAMANSMGPGAMSEMERRKMGCGTRATGPNG
jgi:hypothetical protein